MAGRAERHLADGACRRTGRVRPGRRAQDHRQRHRRGLQQRRPDGAGPADARHAGVLQHPQQRRHARPAHRHRWRPGAAGPGRQRVHGPRHRLGRDRGRRLPAPARLAGLPQGRHLQCGGGRRWPGAAARADRRSHRHGAEPVPAAGVGHDAGRRQPHRLCRRGRPLPLWRRPDRPAQRARRHPRQHQRRCGGCRDHQRRLRPGDDDADAGVADPGHGPVLAEVHLGQGQHRIGVAGRRRPRHPGSARRGCRSQHQHLRRPGRTTAGEPGAAVVRPAVDQLQAQPQLQGLHRRRRRRRHAGQRRRPQPERQDRQRRLRAGRRWRQHGLPRLHRGDRAGQDRLRRDQPGGLRAAVGVDGADQARLRARHPQQWRRDHRHLAGHRHQRRQCLHRHPGGRPRLLLRQHRRRPHRRARRRQRTGRGPGHP